MRTFRSLGSDGRRLIFEAVVLPALVSLSFRLAGVARTQALLRRLARAKPALKDANGIVASARRAQRIVKKNFGIEGSCLTRSLTLWAMLLRRGVETDLRVGFRKNNGKLEGHAWVEYKDEPLNEGLGVREAYSVFRDPAAFDALTRGTRPKRPPK